MQSNLIETMNTKKKIEKVNLMNYKPKITDNPRLSSTLSKLFFGIRFIRHLLFSRFFSLGSRVSFEKGVTIQNGKYISLGNRVFLERNVTLKFLEEFSGYNFKKPNLKIEDNVFIGEDSIITAAKSIHIKKDVLIGPNCFIGDHDHEYRNVTVPISKQGYTNVKDIIIEEGAWIAANSTICSGVTIGKNSAIGANSVVVDSIPPFCLAVGSPAKIVKRFNEKNKKWESKK